MRLRYILFLSFILPIASLAQGWGLGLRLGDPTGVSAKYYKSRLSAEFNLGWSYPVRGYDYRDYFYKKYPIGHGYEYIDYRSSSSVDFQMHILWSNPIKEVKNLKLYAGLGPQFRYRTFYYDYYDLNYRGIVLSDIYYGYDIGLDGTFGLEYFIPDLPVAVFFDGTLFLEFADQPLALWPQFGIGARYNFF